MPVDTYERGQIFRASNGETYQLVRMFQYKGTNFFNLINTNTGKMRRSDLTKSLRTTADTVSVQELNDCFSPLTFTPEGRVEDYIHFLRPVFDEEEVYTLPTPPKSPQKSLWDEFMTLVDSIS